MARLGPMRQGSVHGSARDPGVEMRPRSRPVGLRSSEGWAICPDPFDPARSGLGSVIKKRRKKMRKHKKRKLLRRARHKRKR